MMQNVTSYSWTVKASMSPVALGLQSTDSQAVQLLLRCSRRPNPPAVRVDGRLVLTNRGPFPAAVGKVQVVLQQQSVAYPMAVLADCPLDGRGRVVLPAAAGAAAGDAPGTLDCTFRLPNVAAVNSQLAAELHLPDGTAVLSAPALVVEPSGNATFGECALLSGSYSSGAGLLLPSGNGGALAAKQRQVCDSQDVGLSYTFGGPFKQCGNFKVRLLHNAWGHEEVELHALSLLCSWLGWEWANCGGGAMPRHHSCLVASCFPPYMGHGRCPCASTTHAQAVYTARIQPATGAGSPSTGVATATMAISGCS
jgi:hypothetical protein